MTPFPQCWDYRCARPHLLFSRVLGMDYRLVQQPLKQEHCSSPKPFFVCRSWDALNMGGKCFPLTEPHHLTPPLALMFYSEIRVQSSLAQSRLVSNMQPSFSHLPEYRDGLLTVSLFLPSRSLSIFFPHPSLSLCLSLSPFLFLFPSSFPPSTSQ